MENFYREGDLSSYKQLYPAMNLYDSFMDKYSFSEYTERDIRLVMQYNSLMVQTTLT